MPKIRQFVSFEVSHLSFEVSHLSFEVSHLSFEVSHLSSAQRQQISHIWVGDKLPGEPLRCDEMSSLFRDREAGLLLQPEQQDEKISLQSTGVYTLFSYKLHLNNYRYSYITLIGTAPLYTCTYHKFLCRIKSTSRKFREGVRQQVTSSRHNLLGCWL